MAGPNGGGGGDRGDRRDQKSWRERDAQKDRNGGAQRREERDKSPGFGTAAANSSKQYRAALDALFEKGGFAKLAEKLSPASAALPGSISQTGDKPPREPAKPRDVPTALDENKAGLRKKLLDAIGRDEITRAVDRYTREHPLPVEFEVLEQVIEHRKPERVAEAMTLIEQLLEKEKPKRSRVLNAKLRHIEETTDEKDVREQAVRIRAKLG